MSALCHNCGTQIDEDVSKWCPKCRAAREIGERLKDEWRPLAHRGGCHVLSAPNCTCHLCLVDELVRLALLNRNVEQLVRKTIKETEMKTKKHIQTDNRESAKQEDNPALPYGYPVNVETKSGKSAVFYKGQLEVLHELLTPTMERTTHEDAQQLDAFDRICTTMFGRVLENEVVTSTRKAVATPVPAGVTHVSQESLLNYVAILERHLRLWYPKDTSIIEDLRKASLGTSAFPTRDERGKEIPQVEIAIEG